MTSRSTYRKKPVEIEAMQFTGDNGDEVAEWCGGSFETVTCHGEGPPTVVFIETLEGRMSANIGDYVIRGVQGKFYPCKPDIFAATYDPVVPVTAPVPAVTRWLDQLDEAHQAATPGPWYPAIHAGDIPIVVAEGFGFPAECTDPNGVPNAVWIATAHEAVPALTSALRAVLDLADEMDGEALTLRSIGGRTGWLQGQKVANASARIRAAVAVAAPDTSEDGK